MVDGMASSSTYLDPLGCRGASASWFLDLKCKVGWCP